MEPPECPVCLQVYDQTSAIPRVLTCGHTTCELCVTRLLLSPSSTQNFTTPTFRCPVCTQLITCQGPISSVGCFPKNIDLLQFCPQSSSTFNSRTSLPPPPLPDDPLPFPWDNRLFSEWKKFVIPSDSIDVDSIVTSETKESVLTFGRLNESVPNIREVFVGENRAVSLVIVGSSPVNVVGKAVRLSYMGRVIDVVSRMGEKERNGLSLILNSLSAQTRGLVSVYGLWMNPVQDTGDSLLYLACELLDSDLSCLLIDREEKGCSDENIVFGIVGMDLCEALMNLHERGIVCGCLSPSCFRFDVYGHCCLDLNHVLLTGRKFLERIARGELIDGDDLIGKHSFVSPELLLLLHEKDDSLKYDYKVVHTSDVWSLGCMLVMVLLRNAPRKLELLECLYYKERGLLSADMCTNFSDKIMSALKDLSLGKHFNSLLQAIQSCLSYDPEIRPRVCDMWRCIRELLMKVQTDCARIINLPLFKGKELYCLFMFNSLSLRKCVNNIPKIKDNNLLGKNSLDDSSHDICSIKINCQDTGRFQQGDEDVNDGIVGSLGKGIFKSITLKGHRHYVTNLAIGGGYLFSSSDDKTICVWSLQDFSHLQTLTGHEHRIMALVASDSTEVLCISGDNGGFIFVWAIGTSTNHTLLKKWREHDDWLFTGVHSLAILGSQYVCNGSGDKSIKFWSLQDYSLVCKVQGHDSTVSSLVVANGIIYSGSWDGKVCLWRLDNINSILAKLPNFSSGHGFSVLSLSVKDDLIAATYDNGYIQIWKNDVPMKLMQIDEGPIYTSHIEKRWLLTGGWDKSIKILELSENEFQVDAEIVGSIDCDSGISSLLYWQDKLFVGINENIKVYYQQ